jgi:predicted transposase YbfD/YdcC
MESNTKNVLNEEGQLINLLDLLMYLKRITDGRKRRGIRYSIEMIFLLFILAKLCGENKTYGIADWVQQRKGLLIEALQLPYSRLPHHSTYRRIMSEKVDPNEVEQILASYLAQLPRRGQDIVLAIDGKTVRGTITTEDPFGLHLLAAYLPGSGIVLMQMVVEKDKENEIVIAPKLLKCLDLTDKIVIGDAMQTQRQLSIQIVSSGGHFVWIVKDNQANTRKAIEQLFAPEKRIPGVGNPPMDFCSARTVDKQAGRIEERSITVSNMLNNYLDWPHLQQVFKIERRVTTLSTGEVSTEVQYGLTSLPSETTCPTKLLGIIRSEWGIESGLHYRRDVTFQEDRTRMTDKSMAMIVASIHNLVISLLNCRGYQNHAQARRIFDASPTKALDLIRGL